MFFPAHNRLPLERNAYVILHTEVRSERVRQADLTKCPFSSRFQSIRMTVPEPLRTPIPQLPGMTPLRAEQFRRLGLFRARDLLFYFPRDYEDLTDRRDLKDLEAGKLQSVQGTIDRWTSRTTRRGPLTTLFVHCGDGYVKAQWFNMPFVTKPFEVGRRVLVTGKPKDDPPYWIMNHPTVTYLADDEEIDTALEPFLPIYGLTEGLTQYHVRRTIKGLLPGHVPLLDEVFPRPFLEDHRLLTIHEAVPAIHFPPDRTVLEYARRRFVYQELFILQLALAMRRLQHRTHFRATPLKSTPAIDQRARRLFPFTLTAAQEKVIGEITADMERPIPMNRLLQGDVGSGKTVVALYAMLLAVANGCQAVLMAPTEVLARQHLRTLERMLEGSRVKIAPFFGGQRPAERSAVLQSIAAGESQVIVGTQAIIAGEVAFHQLGLVVIDEQHKFGVRQRAALKTGGKFDPHYLVMTATPIPRSVTMTLFGDLDVSIMDAMPPGRQKVKTYIPRPDQRDDWWKFVRRKIEAGRHGYVVVPLVEESEHSLIAAEQWNRGSSRSLADPPLPADSPTPRPVAARSNLQRSAVDVRSLRDVFESLRDGPLRGLRLEMMHGRMSTEEKERIMLDFRSGEIQVLVATTVIEVGVDVPNAALLTVENGERFGLAQLHQLRGRIGRGKHPGFCAIFANPTTEEAAKRLRAFERLTDGFKLAEKDFELRGSGDLFGTAQHGMPPMRIADLIRDRDILVEARADATALVRDDPGLARPEHEKLRRQMLARYGGVLALGDVG